MKIPEGFKSIGVRELTVKKIPLAVAKAIQGLDALDFGLIASSAEVAAMAGMDAAGFRREHSRHPALAPYRFKKMTGSPLFWGNKESIKKLIEANAQ